MKYRKTDNQELMNPRNNISKIMTILEKHFNYQERTTLNKMRENLDDDKNPFKILIACLLSLRSRDETTEKISQELFSIADTPEKIIAIPTSRLEGIIYSTGHYHKKAKSLKSVSQELIDRFKGIVPNTREDLLSIKGIGPKTANIVLNFAYNQPTLPIDTHCHRIPNRLGWINTKTPEQTETALYKVLPQKYWFEFNGIFVLFGRTLCQPVSPWCSKCPVERFCPKFNVKKRR
ncbi:endonuclease III [Candidatus Pacearchaeota archaeon]|nr:endonuclease III [Candidatus Pacearchaeota archaeon]